ncbi:MAG: hypothetical protein E7261_12495 [Lachnospiraceae bacterium]|nr:hypothetical protein [Lachnospiraceae bacterium]
MNKRKLLGFVLAIAMVLGSTSMVMAGSDYYSTTLSQFYDYYVYYDAYCGSSFGDAATTVYVDSTADWAYTYVSADLYIIDSYYADNISEDDILERLAVGGGSGLDSRRGYGEDRVDVSVMLAGINTAKYEGFKIVSEHEAEVTNMVTSYSDDCTLTAYHRD